MNYNNYKCLFLILLPDNILLLLILWVNYFLLILILFFNFFRSANCRSDTFIYSEIYSCLPREILGIISFISLVVFYISYKNNPNFLIINNKVDNHSKFRMFLIFLSIFGLFLFLLREFSPFLYLFESHDVHVFGPTIELFNSQYIGNLKNPIIFPLELSAYHILPGTFLGAANFLNPTIDLITLINAKYFLTTLFLSYCFFKIFIFSNFSISSFAAGIILLFFFKETFGYNLSISSYLYQSL